MRNALLYIIVLFTSVSDFSGQDYTAFRIEGRIQDLERKFSIEGAHITLFGENGFSLSTTSDTTGYYSIGITMKGHSHKFIVEVVSEDHYTASHEFQPPEAGTSVFNYDLMPLMICTDRWFPIHFVFAANSSTLNTDDSLAVALRFSNPEIKPILESYSYHIITRRSTDESDQTALERGQSLRKLLMQQGINPQHISIENRASSDFFYCKYCDGCVYQYLEGQGLEVTQELIDHTSDPAIKEEYESMRRIAQIELKKLN